MASLPLRILVVDDDRDTADSLAVLLRIKGHAADVAYDGDSALQVAEHSLPQVVFLDLAMPKMDGLALAAELRRVPGMAKCHLVCLTGYGGAEYRARARKAGCAHFFIKPSDLKDIDRILDEVAGSQLRVFRIATDEGSVTIGDARCAAGRMPHPVQRRIGEPPKE